MDYGMLIHVRHSKSYYGRMRWRSLIGPHFALPAASLANELRPQLHLVSAQYWWDNPLVRKWSAYTTL